MTLNGSKHGAGSAAVTSAGADESEAFKRSNDKHFYSPTIPPRQRESLLPAAHPDSGRVSPGCRRFPGLCTQTAHSSSPSAASINDGCSASLWLNIHRQRCSSRSLNSLAALPASSTHTHTRLHANTHTLPAAH